jgi:hypothetical protein
MERRRSGWEMRDVRSLSSTWAIVVDGSRVGDSYISDQLRGTTVQYEIKLDSVFTALLEQ